MTFIVDKKARPSDNDLPEGVLEEIMSWLPPESLRRFKLVHKSWYLRINTLMNDSVFVAKHLRNMKTKAKLPASYCQLSHLIIVKAEGEPEFPVDDEDAQDGRRREGKGKEIGRHLLISANDYHSGYDCIPRGTDIQRTLDFYLDSEYFIVASQCDGIVCLSYIYGDSVYLLNPALREWRTIRCSRDVNVYESRGVGFGYDSRSDEYKVVAFMTLDVAVAGCDLTEYYRDPPYTAEVYSLKTNTWREVKGNVQAYRLSGDHEEVYCNGACYWYYWDGYMKMYSFDFSDEVFRFVPLPAGVEHPGNWPKELVEWTMISVWKESLVLFSYTIECPKVIDMWVLDAQPGGVEGTLYSWTKHVTIGPLDGIRRPLGFWDDVELFLETEDDEIKLYHLGYEMVNGNSTRVDWLHEYRFLVYQKSLVSVLKKEGRRSVV